ncbi:MAG: Crp/Fnr family transcriptional regulator [Lachnospiraceae bacterium]|nr:Crp/Fnr family transcriptional regulator [Lachnospiraceae bacterium]
MKQIDLLEKVPLFRGVSEETVRDLQRAEGCRKTAYEKGEYLCRSGQPLDGLLVIMGGRAQVRKGSVLLRDLTAGDVTGVSALYSGDTRMETDIRAGTRVTALFLSRDAMTAALQNDPQLVRNYIVFLSTRIRFLNGIIRRFSASDATRRLAGYLLEQVQGRAQDREIPFRATRAAEELGISRASLYRALDALRQAGCIEKKDRGIVITNTERMQEILDLS